MAQAGKCTAVVVIHGMGEQKPMDTLRGFVEAVWQTDDSLFLGLAEPRNYKLSDAWSEPDDLSGTTELRRITTRPARSLETPGKPGDRVDFFELHWADLTADTTWSDFVNWLRVLLFRKPPPRLRLMWLLIWIVALGAVVPVVTTGIAKGFDLIDLTWTRPLSLAGLFAVIGLVAKQFLSSYFGDVARYVTAAPRNIKVRESARERGLKLLSDLSASGHYGRIVVVGHSLGSILAHDLVWFAWSRAARTIRFAEDSSLYRAVRSCEQAADALLDAAGYTEVHRPSVTGRGRCEPLAPRSDDFHERVRKFRLEQRALFYELARHASRNADSELSRWLISDLVTVGSPLTHADFLLARSRDELCSMTHMREVLRCPPLLDDEEDGILRFSSNEQGDRSGDWKFHHASAMGPVRWTNISNAAGPVLFWMRDVISGPLAPNFGPGVVDVSVDISRRLGLIPRRLFTHTMYWRDPIAGTHRPTTDHVQALRDALNLLDDDSVERRVLSRTR